MKVYDLCFKITLVKEVLNKGLSSSGLHPSQLMCKNISSHQAKLITIGQRVHDCDGYLTQAVGLTWLNSLFATD